MLKRATVLALAVSWSVGAQAVDWFNVGGNERTMTYIDADSIRQKGEKTEAWTQSVYAAPLHGEIRATRIKSEYDCAGGYFRTLEYVYFGVDGKYMNTEPSETINERKYPSPNSINEVMLQFVCKRVGGTRVPDPVAHAMATFGGQ